MSGRRARIVKLVKIARGEDENLANLRQDVSHSNNSEQEGIQNSLLVDTNSTHCSSEILDVSSLTSCGPNITKSLTRDIENRPVIESNDDDYSLLLLLPSSQHLESNMAAREHSMLRLSHENVESVESTHANITHQDILESPNNSLQSSSHIIVESAQPHLEQSPQEEIVSSLFQSHYTLIPGPSRITIDISDQTIQDFSSGSSDIWQPTYVELNRDQSSSDSEAVSENLRLINENSSDFQPASNAAIKRKRGHGPMQRKLRKIRSECRKKGQEYVTAKGKCILAKRPCLLPDTCRAKCYFKTKNLDLVKIFEDYRNLPSRDSQKRYLAGLMTIKPKERSKRSAITKNREVTVCYTIDGAEGDICKNCFIKVFAESRGFIDDIIKKKKKSPTSIITNLDLRTARQCPGNKRSEEDITFAKDFINSLPAYESHYSRNHTSKRYLEHNLNLQVLYNLYKKKNVYTTGDSTAKPLSLSVFRNVFKSLNLKFKKPSNDTCKTCDAMSLKIKACVLDEDKQRLESERTEHQNKADLHYQIKKSDKIRSYNSGGKIVVVAFDLQKCLATPNLTASVSFYKRKLWTFNLTIRNITNKHTNHYVWHESIAQRGADEIASCLWHFINSLSEEVEELVLFSDTCPGQNRNNILPVMFSMVLERKTSLKKIHHKFLVPGHTHLDCDTDHAAIERFVKSRNSTISVPQDWVSVIKLTSNRYNVQLLTQSDFFAFSKLLTTHFVKRNTAKDKSSFAWNSIFWLTYEKSTDVGFKYTLSEDEQFRFFSIKRRGKTVPFAEIDLPLAYNEPIQIDHLKYKDILDLLPFIDPIYHDFYKSLPHTQPRTTHQQYVSDSEEDFD